MRFSTFFCAAGPILLFLGVNAISLVKIDVVPPYSNSTDSRCNFSTSENIWNCPSITSAITVANSVNLSSDVRVSFTGNHIVNRAPLQVTRSMEILGSGFATLDARGAATILMILGKGVSVDNVHFTGANASHVKNAAPIIVGQHRGRDMVHPLTPPPPPAPAPTDKRVTFSRCTFSNLTGSTGGAILLVEGSCLVLDSCEFSSNLCDRPQRGGPHDWWGGGAIFVDRASLIVQNTTFIRNRALDHGGAIMNYMGQVQVSDSTFVGNVGAQGGAMYTFMWGSITLRRCLFRDNWAGECPTCHAGSKAGHGGALFTDRGILTVFDSVFINNSQAVWMWSTKESKNSNQTLRNVTLSNCTFTSNHVNGSGGAVYNQWSTLYVLNSIFRGNTATKDGAAVASDAQSQTFVSGSDFDMITDIAGFGFGPSYMCMHVGTYTIPYVHACEHLHHPICVHMHTCIVGYGFDAILCTCICILATCMGVCKRVGL